MTILFVPLNEAIEVSDGLARACRHLILAGICCQVIHEVTKSDFTTRLKQRQDQA
jgi:hypothetical protein